MYEYMYVCIYVCVYCVSAFIILKTKMNFHIYVCMNVRTYEHTYHYLLS